jgi:hypothetical protein
MTEKERLHSLVEELPEPEVHAALRFVEYLRREAADAVARALREAPYDDEPLTADDLAELDAAELDRQEGRVVSHDSEEDDPILVLDLLQGRSPVLLDVGFGEDLLRVLAEESPEERPAWGSIRSTERQK